MKPVKLLLITAALFLALLACLSLAYWYSVSTVRSATFKLFLPTEQIANERLLLLSLTQDTEVCVLSAYQDDKVFIFPEGWLVIEFETANGLINRFAIVGSKKEDPAFGVTYSRVGRVSGDGFQKGCSKFLAPTKVEVSASVFEQTADWIVFDIDIKNFNGAD